VDFHQINGGFGGHFWFTHTMQPNAPYKITGTWTPTTRFNGWARVMVHLPDHGAGTQQAKYTINLGAGTPRVRFLPTQREANNWVSLGAYKFTNTGAQSLVLTNETPDGRGVDDIAWAAAAFIPLPAKPRHMVVAIGDSYGSGEGAGSYYRETDINFDNFGWNACRRSAKSWQRKTVLPGMGGASLGTLVDNVDPKVDFQSVACSGSTADQADGGATPYYFTSPRRAWTPITVMPRASSGRWPRSTRAC
jgi:hypothetical protein